MLGAILGDVIGSPYEFCQDERKKEHFDLFSTSSHMTDDSFMTLAIAKGAMEGGHNKLKTYHSMSYHMQRMGRIYPDAGYGKLFKNWIEDSDPKAYGSWGNGASMRVAAIGWMYDNLEDVEAYARISAQITHDTPEAVRSAQAVAAAIFLARQGSSKSQIQAYLEEHFGYDLSPDYIRELMQQIDEKPEKIMHADFTVPLAFVCFYYGTSFEDAVRKAVAISEDSDTLGAITGSIAEAYYGIPFKLREAGMSYLDPFCRQIYEDYLSYVN